MKEVVIAGAGYSGIITLKICLEYGLDAYVYEKLDHYGGLWRYRDDVDEEGVASVMKSTTINSSKEMQAISDFPPPDHYANYMHNSKMIEYLTDYVKVNHLESRIKYNHEITNLEKHPQYNETGKWKINIKDKMNDKDKTVDAGAVFICTGHHSHPHCPNFEGQEKFEKPIIHSHSLKDPSKFANQRVLVVGVGNSAMDIAADLSFSSKQVYVSTRKGAWIAPRVGSNGVPADFKRTRFFVWLKKHFPNYFRKQIEQSLSTWFDHKMYGLKPQHHYDQQHPTESDILPYRILSGAVLIKGDISRLTSSGVVFIGDEHETEVDAIVLCTGYNVRIPFLPSDDPSLPKCPTENDVGLYQRIYPVQLEHPTLAFVGMLQPIGPMFPIMEMQARYVSSLLTGAPSEYSAKGWSIDPDERAKEVSEYKKDLAKRYLPSQRHTMQVDYPKYMDYLGKKLGVYPNMLKIVFTDPRLFYKLVFGPYVSYQFRLEGPHKWGKARETIMGVEERMRRGFGTGRNPSKTLSDPIKNKCIPIVLTVFCSIAGLALMSSKVRDLLKDLIY